jgi:hypothetical protein
MESENRSTPAARCKTWGPLRYEVLALRNCTRLEKRGVINVFYDPQKWGRESQGPSAKIGRRHCLPNVLPNTIFVAMAPRPRPLEERFWEKVRKGRGCWLWMGTRSTQGYGQLKPPKKRPTIMAHRFAYELLVGPIPSGLLVCHRCDNPPCVRPDHLFLGTPLDNTLDAKAKGRLATGDRSGPRLHPERLARGKRHGSRTHPERVPRGRRHGSQTHPERVPRGADHGRAKLTEADVKFIRANWPRMLQRELAERFGITQCVVSQIVTRRNWKHVP